MIMNGLVEGQVIDRTMDKWASFRTHPLTNLNLQQTEACLFPISK